MSRYVKIEDLWNIGPCGGDYMEMERCENCTLYNDNNGECDISKWIDDLPKYELVRVSEQTQNNESEE